ncbi:class I SAM-dependent methyltransferase [Clostridium felsineum]|uniref:class I SAM-dependent methyltransferase n=1 Tax=Clostridium felsineum TaxID=36839 RepID=UPI00214D4784|nr:class I SAM-dependent methyltransferase [Clostridium felsineum]MCR3757807.1 class I SAM-dependent methyltransferase [Clostridium felsineum]
MISNRFRDDAKEVISLNEVQTLARDNVKEKLQKGIYSYESVKCICNSGDFETLAEKDRYGLPVSTVICRKCGLIMINPRMTQESYNTFYDTEYRKLYVGKESPTEEFFNEQFKRGLSIYEYLKNNGVKDIEKVLEIGTGAGGILKAFKDNGCQVLGVDLGKEYIEFGKTKGIKLINCEAGELLKDYEGEFDLIILSHVMEHFLDINRELNIIKKLLKKNGVLYIELPGVFNMHYSYDCDFLKSLQNAHTYYFTLGTLKQVMELNGFLYINGDESIKSLFRVSQKKTNNKTDHFYKDIKSYLIDLENNREKYVEEYKKFQSAQAEKERNFKFKKVKEEIKKYSDKSIMIYGTGNHTKLLLETLKGSNKILGLLDNNKSQFNNEVYGYKLMDMEKIASKVEAIIISSDVYQEIIYERIKDYEKKGIDIIKIY